MLLRVVFFKKVFVKLFGYNFESHGKQKYSTKQFWSV